MLIAVAYNSVAPSNSSQEAVAAASRLLTMVMIAALRDWT